MRKIFSLILITGLAWPLHAAAPKTAQKSSVAEVFVDLFGEKGFDALHRRGFVSLTEGKDGPRITHVQWPLLRRAEKAAPAYRSFLTLYEKNRKRLSVEGSMENLRYLQREPIGGLITPSVRAAVDTLAALLADAGTLDKRLAAAPENRNLFKAKWAKSFVERRKAALMLSPRSEASTFFSEVLSRQESSAAGREAVVNFLKAVYDADVAEPLDADLKKSKLSPEIREQLADYLADQRLLWTVSETRRRLREIERAGSLLKDAADIELVLAGLEKEGSAAKMLHNAIASRDSSDNTDSGIRFSGPELHVHADDGSATLDAGDTAAISMAFWIYGVREGKEIEVSQLSFVDRGAAGISNRTETKKRLKNGGPYSFSTKIPILTHEPFTFRLFLESSDAEPFSREIEIQPSPRYQEILLVAAEADREAASCMLDDAIARYEAAIETLKPLTGKRRFDELHRNVQARLRKAQNQADQYQSLQGAVDGAKLFASKEQCDYRDDRARNALSLLSKLPAGCDAMPEGPSGHSLSEELRDLMRQTHRRAQAQEAFRRAVKKARSREGRCKADEAAGLYAAALSLLDAESGARCGDWEQEYTLVRIEDFPRALGASQVAGAFAAAADKAEENFSKGNVADALQILLPTLAKINEMPDADCYDSSRRRLADLTEAYGIALSPGTANKTAAEAKLPKDSTEKAVTAVIAERRRRENKKRVKEAVERNQQAPDSASSDGGNR